MVLAITFLITINTAIVNVALTGIRDALGFSDSSISWAVNAYLLAYGGLLITGGRLGDVIGRRRAMLLGLVAFTVAAAVAGAAGNSATLIVARAVQGVGAAFAAPRGHGDHYPPVARRDAREGAGMVQRGARRGLSAGMVAGGVILVLVQSLTDISGALLAGAALVALALAATFLRDRPSPTSAGTALALGENAS